jgi:hypothetical protein
MVTRAPPGVTTSTTTVIKLYMAMMTDGRDEETLGGIHGVHTTVRWGPVVSMRGRAKVRMSGSGKMCLIVVRRGKRTEGL